MKLEYLEHQSIRQPQQLVILLHGYGANGHNLISLASSFSKALPNALFIAPHAPFQLSGYHHEAFQWFAFDQNDKQSMVHGLEEAARILCDFIEDRISVMSLKPQDVVLIGFSQGTMVALHVLLYKMPVRCVVGYSGMLLSHSRPIVEHANASNVLLIHGAKDSIIPSHAMYEAQEALVKLGITCEAVIRPNLAHSIDNEGLAKAGSFLANVFKE
ncbi:phospholipase [Rickettsiales endosymbiont of Peranema trichophorum]|uniref:alpha/beta hydrolase n=1 Tax=Rickettsiales endosymbiont of Peranema trichophorum TaxID=2486577 RepID=UPI0010234DDA|nr:alpha/beta fold hydrolase [Rickettsiales endosymbiont of Peranema trichophorum]RZI47797.1 phospholipase [Rickettsiales endosymbiont of Peranema trichophorum]